MSRYSKIVLKLSGELLAGKGGFGWDTTSLANYVGQVATLREQGIQLALVVGGGNIWRGAQGAVMGLPLSTADHMGMLSTIINGLALQGSLAKAGIPCTLFSTISMPTIASFYTQRAAKAAFDAGKVVIAAGGMGKPYFTTDTTASFLSIDLEVDLLVKATSADGIYDKDPHKHDDAQRYDYLSWDQVFVERLRVMDHTAFALCLEHRMPIAVYSAYRPQDLEALLQGKQGAGTLVGPKQ
jgi:uridylate kinase